MADQFEKLLRQEEQLRRDLKIREQVFGHYGQACSCCGAVKGLTIDHINGDGKAHRGELQGDFYAWLIRNGFPPGFQVLCIPCNSSKGDGLVCKMHDETRNLKRLWLALPRQHRIAFLAWVPELDPERPESIWGELRPVLDQVVPAAPDQAVYQAPVEQVAQQLVYQPPVQRMQELLSQAGPHGYTVSVLSKALSVDKDTLLKWLCKDEELGRVRRGGRTRYGPCTGAGTVLVQGCPVKYPLARPLTSNVPGNRRWRCEL